MPHGFAINSDASTVKRLAFVALLKQAGLLAKTMGFWMDGEPFENALPAIEKAVLSDQQEEGRDEFFQQIVGLDDFHVSVSASDSLGDVACLIQIGTDKPPITCAYLDDDGVRELILALARYSAAL